MGALKRRNLLQPSVPQPLNENHVYPSRSDEHKKGGAVPPPFLQKTEKKLMRLFYTDRFVKSYEQAPAAISKRPVSAFCEQLPF